MFAYGRWTPGSLIPGGGFFFSTLSALSVARAAPANTNTQRTRCVCFISLGKDVVHHLTCSIGQAEIASTVAIGQLRMINSVQVENGRVQVVHVHLLVYCCESEIVGGAVGDSTFDAAASHPHREATDV